MRRKVVWVVAIVVLALLCIGVWRRTRRPSYAPVVARTALDGWRATWSDPPPNARSAVLPKRWIVIGWDGAGWDLALPLVDAGKMPNLEALMREGAYGDMYSFQPTWSPVLWTTVATGVDPSRHGILAWGRIDEGTGQTKRLFTNADRRVRALWNLASDAGGDVLVVGYHNTYPADRVKGMMVSNYLYHEHLEERMEADKGPSEAMSGLVYPTEKLKEVLEIQREVAASLPKEIGRFASYSKDEAPAFEAPLARALRPGEDQRKFFLRKSYLFDTFNGRVAEAEYPKIAPELMMVHFQCIDLAGHYFLYFNDPARFKEMPWTREQRAELEAQQHLYAGTIEAFYRYADEWLGRLVALRTPDTGVLLLSDHGFEPEPDPHRTGYHVSAPPGIFVLAGPGVRPGHRADAATLYDVMPTLAAAMGLPVARDLKSTPQASWFTPEAWRSLAIKSVPTYEVGGRYVPDVPSPDATEKELMDQLRAIGYIR